MSSEDVYDGSERWGRWTLGRWFRRFGPVILSVVFAIILMLLTVGRQPWA